MPSAMKSAAPFPRWAGVSSGNWSCLPGRLSVDRGVQAERHSDAVRADFHCPITVAELLSFSRSKGLAERYFGVDSIEELTWSPTVAHNHSFNTISFIYYRYNR